MNLLYSSEAPLQDKLARDFSKHYFQTLLEEMLVRHSGPSGLTHLMLLIAIYQNEMVIPNTHCDCSEVRILTSC